MAEIGQIEKFDRLREMVLAEIEDDSSEVTDFFTAALYTAEVKVANDLDMNRMQQTVSGALTSTNTSGRYSEVRPVSSINDGTFQYYNHVFANGKKLKKLDYSAIKEINRLETSVASEPSYWAYQSKASALMIAPPVSVSGTTFEINYTKKPRPLSWSNSVNILIEAAPDLLFSQTMIRMSTFLHNWETVGYWTDEYERLLASHLNTTRRERKEIASPTNPQMDTNQSTMGVR
jgi:hypothetical protein